MKDIFGFAKHQQKAVYGLGYKLTLTRNTDNAALNKADAIKLSKIKINAFEMCVPHYTPSVSQEAILIKQIVNKHLQSFNMLKDPFS